MTFSAEANNADDDGIVTRAQEGDVSAFETLYRQHLPMIFSLCYRMVADRSLAEELTQEAFIRIWHKLDLFQGQSQFSTWVYRLAKNVVLSSLRKGKLMGVCAGLADFYDIDRNFVRIGTILLGWFFTTPVLFLYIAAGLLLPRRPEWTYY